MVLLTIGDKTFQSQKACKLHVQTLLKTMSSESAYIEIHPAHGNFPLLSALFERHPDRLEKLNGQRIVCFIFERPFHLSIKLDSGDIRSFSWNVCITGKPRTQKQMITNCMRGSISGQIQEFKNSAVYKCSKCPCAANLEVDHIHAFADIAKLFFSSLEDFDEASMRISPGKHLQAECFDLTDEYTKSFDDMWKEDHLQQAELQYLCRTCHRVKTGAFMKTRTILP